MCATAMRSFAQWDHHPQAKALVRTPPVSLIRIGDAPKRLPTEDPSRPLDDIRVLDLSRVLAGPVAGRTLAAYGADVLLVTSPNLPALPVIDIDTSLGKRTTQLDLRQHSDKEILRGLCKESDVFLQAYRPGGLNDKGFGTHELAKLRPGIICANLTAWGWDGPWKDRRGFDSLVQTATGFNVAEDEAYRDFCKLERHVTPKPFPLQALDHAAGYLLAYGINAALCKSMTEGGSWEVRVSLAAVGQWVRSLGRLSPEEAFGKGRPFPQPLDSEVVALSTDWPQDNSDTTARLGVHEITAIKHAAILSKTPAKEGRYSQAPMVLNAHPPSWLS
ncbi:CoA-transferase family III domain-containing protein [Collybia nuda]|uniref:CoA-transferase family III domain-containing protein n=1 Tax=Collybia nuda TaxID=64659 RepID=A0A9P6CJF9_9AGAR|nr:CoA-transferase family III domain-containing protein [Collybia nuda]